MGPAFVGALVGAAFPEAALVEAVFAGALVVAAFVEAAFVEAAPVGASVRAAFAAAGFVPAAFVAAGFVPAAFVAAGFEAAGFVAAGFEAAGFEAAGFAGATPAAARPDALFLLVASAVPDLDAARPAAFAPGLLVLALPTAVAALALAPAAALAFVTALTWPFAVDLAAVLVGAVPAGLPPRLAGLTLAAVELCTAVFFVAAVLAVAARLLVGFAAVALADVLAFVALTVAGLAFVAFVAFVVEAGFSFAALTGVALAAVFAVLLASVLADDLSPAALAMVLRAVVAPPEAALPTVDFRARFCSPAAPPSVLFFAVRVGVVLGIDDASRPLSASASAGLFVARPPVSTRANFFAMLARSAMETVPLRPVQGRSACPQER
jgi:hypothetical protein